MNLARLFSLGTCALALVVSSASAQEYVLNGDFENPDITGSNPFGNGAFYLPVFPGTPVLTNWTVSSPGGGNIDIVRQGSDYLATSGAQYVDLAGTPGPGVISQVVSVPLPGLYTFSFFYANNPGAAPQANVNIQGALGTIFNQVFTHTTSTSNNLDWTFFSTTITVDPATAGSGFTLQFADLTGGSQGIFIDRVSVTNFSAIPEPSTYAAGALIMGALGWHQRRRFRKA